MKKSILWSIAGLLLTSGAWSATGVAIVHGTAPNSTIQGTVDFQDTKEGLKVTAKISGLPPGNHGFHIHEFGSCDDSGKAAGSHYNPMNQPHGDMAKAGVMHVHAGDLGNIVADASGHALLESMIPNVTLAEGPYTVAGRALIIHEKADDFSQPAGNAGGRIGCAPIVLVAGSVTK